ncbi:MAG: hypothetical protein LBB87_02295 [Nitrososphaerota archaeon]|jgi:hypothetical protein|nr:hypothetical protein [Nitrososphaerota archaeon]
MKSEKRLVVLSILALVLGIAVIIPLIYTPLVTEPPRFVNGFRVVNPVPSADGDYVIPYFVDGYPTYVAIPSTDNAFSSVGNYTLIPIEVYYGDGDVAVVTITDSGFTEVSTIILVPSEDFYEAYGYTTTFWVPESDIGE